jgi:hypothetical protein
MANYEEAKLQFHKAIQWQETIGQPMEEVYASYSQKAGYCVCSTEAPRFSSMVCSKWLFSGLHSKSL